MHLIPTVPEICCTLGAIGPVAIPELVAQLTNANALSRASAIAGLRRLGRDAESTVPAVRQAIQDQDSRVRKSAVRMLGDALPSKVNLDALIKCLTDPDMWVRRDAAEAIGKYGEEGVSAIWALTAATTDESAYVAEAAKHAIELINSAFTDEPSEGKR